MAIAIAEKVASALDVFRHASRTPEGADYFCSHPASVALVTRNLCQYSHIGELTNGSVRYTLRNEEFTLHERRIDSGMTQYEIHNFPCR